MPRTYIRKTQDKYSQDDLERALSDVRDKKLSVKNAAIKYQIPIRTIHYRLSGSRTDAGRGAKTILTKEEESLLVRTILLFQQWQCPLSPSTIIGLAKPYMLQLGKKVSEESTLRDWFQGFMKRHASEIKLAKTVKLEKARSEACQKETIGEYCAFGKDFSYSFNNVLSNCLTNIFQIVGLIIFKKFLLSTICTIDQKQFGMSMKRGSAMIPADDQW